VGARGDGLLQALVLDRPMAGDVVTAALELGLVVNDVAPDAVRLAPALTIGEADVEEMAIMLHRALTQVETQAEKAGHDEQGLRDRGRTA
jgi:acetylornithine/N-succinyldiaminopimelate aminotransferase